MKNASRLLLLLWFPLCVALCGVPALASCNTIKDHARDVAGDVVDCTISTVKEHSDQYGPLVEQMIRDAVSPDGTVDWPRVRAASNGLALETGGCVLAQVIARMLAPPADDPNAPQISALVAAPEPLRAGWEELRRERFGGKRFQLAGGGVL